MRPPSTAPTLPTRAWRRVVVLAAALVLLATTTAVSSAAGPAAGTAVTATTDPGTYGIIPGQGTFTVLTQNNLLPTGGTGSQLFYLSTTGTGVNRLPFRLHLFNQYYSRIAISGNGNVQPGVVSPGGNPSPFQECLPTDEFGAMPSVLPLWGELVYDGTPGNGVFVRTRGTAPHRTFTVSWQGTFAVSFPDVFANAQVTFREDSQEITYTYGETAFQNLVTIGIQSRDILSWATRYCSTAGIYPTNGTRLTLRHFG